MSGLIDPSMDFAAHYNSGGDPDRDCPRLYTWHRALWGRSVPGVPPLEFAVMSGRGFEMSLRTGGSEFRLASDGIIPTWSSTGWARWLDADLAAEIAKDADDFYRIASTIGGYILFPRNRMGQEGSTINQARGVDRRIADRFDLTLECIRLHYSDPTVDNPLGERLAYYADFFALFGDFDGYVRLFLLEDLVTADRAAVLSFMSGEPVSGFSTPALAVNPAQYAEYRRRSLAFGNLMATHHATASLERICRENGKSNVDRDFWGSCEQSIFLKAQGLHPHWEEICLKVTEIVHRVVGGGSTGHASSRSAAG